MPDERRLRHLMPQNDMGTQFWWFYDVVAAAIMLVCVFIAGKKGILKGLLLLTACLIAAMSSFAVSRAAADAMYKAMVRTSNIRKIDKVIYDGALVNKYKNYLESLGYNIVVKTDRLETIFEGDKDYTEELVKYVNSINGRNVESDDDILRQRIREGYAVVISDFAAQTLNKYSAEMTYREVLADESCMNELVPLLMNHDSQYDASIYIIDHFTAGAYITLFRLGCFAVLFVILAFIVGIIIRSMAGDRDAGSSGVAAHIVGGLFGLVTGGILVFVTAAVVRLWTIMGSNEMLFFNNEAVDESFIFRYFYDFASKM